MVFAYNERESNAAQQLAVRIIKKKGFTLFRGAIGIIAH